MHLFKLCKIRKTYIEISDQPVSLSCRGFFPSLILSDIQKFNKF